MCYKCIVISVIVPTISLECGLSFSQVLCNFHGYHRCPEKATPLNVFSFFIYIEKKIVKKKVIGSK